MKRLTLCFLFLSLSFSAFAQVDLSTDPSTLIQGKYSAFGELNISNPLIRNLGVEVHAHIGRRNRPNETIESQSYGVLLKYYFAARQIFNNTGFYGFAKYSTDDYFVENTKEPELNFVDIQSTVLSFGAGWKRVTEKRLVLDFGVGINVSLEKSETTQGSLKNNKAANEVVNVPTTLFTRASIGYRFAGKPNKIHRWY